MCAWEASVFVKSYEHSGYEAFPAHFAGREMRIKSETPASGPGWETNCLARIGADEAPIFLSDLIVEDWVYVIPHFLRFFISMI